MNKEWRPYDSYAEKMEREKPKFFAVVPIHGRCEFIEGVDMSEVDSKVDNVLESPSKNFPNFNFRENIIYIRGEKYDR